MKEIEGCQFDPSRLFYRKSPMILDIYVCPGGTTVKIEFLKTFTLVSQYVDKHCLIAANKRIMMLGRCF
jgi:hypothetical protein